MSGSLAFRLIVAVFAISVLNGSQREKVDPPADSSAVTIPYEKYTLSNGLTVILHEDHSDPLVHVDVTYHVGSAREEVGKSGFAHFFAVSYTHLTLPTSDLV